MGAVVGTLRGRAENIAVEGVEISANTTAGGAFGEINTNTKVYNVSVLGTADGKTIATNANNLAASSATLSVQTRLRM